MVRFPSEDLNLQLQANDIAVLSCCDNCGVLHDVLTIHILFVIGALYRHRTASIVCEANNYEVDCRSIVIAQ